MLAPENTALRAKVEQAIEELIALLDAIDGDPDLEEGGDLEPYLGGFNGASDDRESDADEAA